MGDETNRIPKFLLPALLSTTAGAVDVIGFLALGVFTAHITGNLVILAAHYVTGRFGEIGDAVHHRETMPAEAAGHFRIDQPKPQLAARTDKVRGQRIGLLEPK